jgi:hypothetical protein
MEIMVQVGQGFPFSSSRRKYHRYRGNRLNPHGQANTNKNRLNSTHSTKSHSSYPSPHISTCAL